MKAWLPIDRQTVLSGRSIQTYYTGMAPDYEKGGILLFNPITKRTIIRRTYKVMGPVDQPDSQVSFEALDFKPVDDIDSGVNMPINSTQDTIEDQVLHPNDRIPVLESDEKPPQLVGGDESDD